MRAKKASDRSKHKGKKCLFCDRTDLSKTHIWPEWLDKLLAPSKLRLEEVTRGTEKLRQHVRLGSVFTQKPYLACVCCNTGWMHSFEDEMLKFAPRIFASSDPITLTETQTCVLAGWLALIVILAEHIGRTHKRISISERDRSYIKQHREPPSQWSIFAASVTGPKWKAHYHHFVTYLGQFANIREYDAAVQEGRLPNTQISSFGIGGVSFHVFVSPDPRFVADFRRQAIATKLIQIWPRPWLRIGRTPKFPTKLVFTDEQADAFPHAYQKRIEIFTRPPPRGGPFG